MIIALTQREVDIRGWQYDCTSQAWYQFLQRHTMRLIPNRTGDSKKWHLKGVDCLLLTGGDASPNRNRVEEFAVNYFLDQGLPIIGVCHGAFFLNHYLGGRNGDIEGHMDTRHKITMEGHEHYVNSYHTLSLDRLSNELDATAWDKQGHPEAFKHRYQEVWGVLWHPERMDQPVLPTDLQELLDA